MIFPFTIKYQKHIDIQSSEDNIEDVINYIENFVKEKDGNIVISNKSKLVFKSSFFTPSWKIFLPIEKGEFNLIYENDKYKLTYEFYMFRLFIIVGLMSFFMWLVSREVEMLLMSFAWLGGMNWLVAIIRHKLMFSEILNGIKNQ